VIPGWRYRMFVRFVQMMPGGLMRRISAASVRRYRRRK
jgi:hypothetical protein